MKIRRQVTAVCFGGVMLLASGRAVGLGISEIHYHPPDGEGVALEFVELENPDNESVSLSGWRLTCGIGYVFPAGTVLSPGAYLVVAQDPEQLRDRFGLGADGVYGPFDGQLSNGGEDIVLVDASNTFVDAVHYDNEPTWPTSADGAGSSLQRINAQAPPWSSASWCSSPPTPLGSAVENCVAVEPPDLSVFPHTIDA